MNFLKKCQTNFTTRESLIAVSKIFKKTWDTVKEVIGKTKTLKNDIPKRITLDGIETFDQNKINNEFNKCFTEIRSKLASSITFSSKDFKQFMVVLETVLQEYTLQDEQLVEVFNSLKFNKVQHLTIFHHLLLNFASVMLFIQLTVFLIFHCKQKFFQMQ